MDEGLRCRRLVNFGGGPQRVPIRGGSWGNGSSAGVFALNLNNPRSDANWNIGFRLALPRRPEGRCSRAHTQRHGGNGALLLAARRKNELPGRRLVGLYVAERRHARPLPEGDRR